MGCISFSKKVIKWKVAQVVTSFLVTDDKEFACNAGDEGSIPGEGTGNPLQCSCLEKSMDRGACWAIVHGIAQGWTQQKRLIYTQMITELTLL